MSGAFWQHFTRTVSCPIMMTSSRWWESPDYSMAPLLSKGKRFAPRSSVPMKISQLVERKKEKLVSCFLNEVIALSLTHLSFYTSLLAKTDFDSVRNLNLVSPLTVVLRSPWLDSILNQTQDIKDIVLRLVDDVPKLHQ